MRALGRKAQRHQLGKDILARSCTESLRAGASHGQLLPSYRTACRWRCFRCTSRRSCWAGMLRGPAINAYMTRDQQLCAIAMLKAATPSFVVNQGNGRRRGRHTRSPIMRCCRRQCEERPAASRRAFVTAVIALDLQAVAEQPPEPSRGLLRAGGAEAAVPQNPLHRLCIRQRWRPPADARGCRQRAPGEGPERSRAPRCAA